MTILEDARSIGAIYCADGREIKVGGDGVTRIEAYGERGQPWFMILQGEYIWQRCNGVLIERVLYL